MFSPASLYIRWRIHREVDSQSPTSSQWYNLYRKLFFLMICVTFSLKPFEAISIVTTSQEQDVVLLGIGCMVNSNSPVLWPPRTKVDEYHHWSITYGNSGTVGELFKQYLLSSAGYPMSVDSIIVFCLYMKKLRLKELSNQPEVTRPGKSWW